jgi:WD40 repeat protein
MQLLTACKGGAVELAFGPDGLAGTFLNHVPVLWTLPASGEPIRLTDKATYFVQHITFSSGGAVVSWLAEQKRHEFDRRTGTRQVVELANPGEGLNAQVVSGPVGRLVVRTVERNVGFRIRAFTPDGKDGWTEMWAQGPGQELSGWELAATADRIFTWEGTHWQQPRRLVARSALTGKVQFETPGPTTWLAGLAAPSDGSLVVGFNASSLYAWRPGEKVEKVRTGTRTHYRRVAFHPDGRHLLAGNNDTTARLIDTHTWEVVRQYTWDIGSLNAVAISPDGALAAAGGQKGRVVVWDLDL